jgi:hypothetical protein
MSYCVSHTLLRLRLTVGVCRVLYSMRSLMWTQYFATGYFFKLAPERDADAILRLLFSSISLNKWAIHVNLRLHNSFSQRYFRNEFSNLRFNKWFSLEQNLSLVMPTWFSNDVKRCLVLKNISFPVFVFYLNRSVSIWYIITLFSQISSWVI